MQSYDAGTLSSLWTFAELDGFIDKHIPADIHDSIKTGNKMMRRRHCSTCLSLFVKALHLNRLLPFFKSFIFVPVKFSAVFLLQRQFCCTFLKIQLFLIQRKSLYKCGALLVLLTHQEIQTIGAVSRCISNPFSISSSYKVSIVLEVHRDLSAAKPGRVFGVLSSKNEVPAPRTRMQHSLFVIYSSCKARFV